MAYGEFLSRGKEDELLAARAIRSSLGGTFEFSSQQEDIEDHIDLWWSRPSKEHPGLVSRIGIDVKGMRKLSRNDPSPSNTITWLETQNVHGLPGSLCGKAKYVAFIRIGKVLLVNREKLLRFALEKIAGKLVVTDRPHECYIPYSRRKWGRNDIAFMAFLDDIENLAEFVIPLTEKNGD